MVPLEDAVLSASWGECGSCHCFDSRVEVGLRASFGWSAHTGNVPASHFGAQEAVKGSRRHREEDLYYSSCLMRMAEPDCQSFWQRERERVCGDFAPDHTEVAPSLPVMQSLFLDKKALHVNTYSQHFRTTTA